jgi:hypothetical protein
MMQGQISKQELQAKLDVLISGYTKLRNFIVAVNLTPENCTRN